MNKKLEELKEFFRKSKEFKTLFVENRNKNIKQKRFWALLRSEIMRKRPLEIKDFLTNKCTFFKGEKNEKTWEIFFMQLAEEFFRFSDENLTREYQAALIKACFEMDAFCRRGKDSGNTRDSGLLGHDFYDKLKIWSVQ
ncbi:MAG: hypothetical protein HOJ48_01840 [Desulfobacula sp.]|jgi:hypothetical protein|nr:hypothetical protein [Desulfobacula sp.]